MRIPKSTYASRISWEHMRAYVAYLSPVLCIVRPCTADLIFHFLIEQFIWKVPSGALHKPSIISFREYMRL